MEREDRMLKLMKEIKVRHKELRSLGYTFSDRASTICLFDDLMFGKGFSYLTDEEQEKSIVAILI